MRIFKILRYIVLAYLIFITLFAIVGIVLPLFPVSKVLDIENEVSQIGSNMSTYPLWGFSFPLQVMEYISALKNGTIGNQYFHFYTFVTFVQQALATVFLVFTIKFLKEAELKQIFSSKAMSYYKVGMIALFIEYIVSLGVDIYFLNGFLTSLGTYFVINSWLIPVSHIIVVLLLISGYVILKKGKEVKEDSDLTI